MAIPVWLVLGFFLFQYYINMEIDSIISKESSKPSSKPHNKQNDEIFSDINISELDMLANKKKLIKESEKNSTHSTSLKSTKKSIPKSETSISSLSTEINDKKKQKKINKENNNDHVRKEKTELLAKISVIINNSHNKYQSHSSLNNSLDEIKEEYHRLKSIVDNEKMVKFCKHGLIMAIKGIEFLNHSYDPLGIDLDGWGESMAYNMETNEYDEVLSELYEKYKGTGHIAPEIKLILMIVMSGTMFAITKKASKNPEVLSDMLNSFISKQSKQQPSEQFQQPHTQQFQHPPQQPQQQPPQQFQPNQEQLLIPGFTRLNQNSYIQDNDTIDSDNVPSKIKDPDSINIDNIIKQMKQQKEKKNDQLDLDEFNLTNLIEDKQESIKNVAMKTKKTRAPRKTNKKLIN